MLTTEVKTLAAAPDRFAAVSSFDLSIFCACAATGKRSAQKNVDSKMVNWIPEEASRRFI
jgi:hypothetical protein